MGRVLSYIHSYALWAIVFVAITACMPKVEEDEVVPVVTLSSHAMMGISSDMKVRLIGSCPGNTYGLRVQVNGQEFSVGDAQSGALVSSSGVPVGWCRGGALQVDYPVPNPQVSRTIRFSVKAMLNDGRSSQDWATRLVNYAGFTPAVPGYAILSAGRLGNSGIMAAASTISASSYVTYAAGGEPTGIPNVSSAASTLTSDTYYMRTGLHGVIVE